MMPGCFYNAGLSSVFIWYSYTQGNNSVQNVPSQSVPLPVKPSLHEQLKPPR
jgi:hypothetical protein